MSGELLRPGGPHNIEREGPDRFSMTIRVPQGEDGLVGRECPAALCSPGYFRVKLGTGIVGESYTKGFCPYCRGEAEPTAFHTKEQMKFAESVISHEVHGGLSRMLNDALDLGPSGRKKLGGGMLSMEILLEKASPPPIYQPVDEELRRDLVCPNCTLVHAVFGLAAWCPDCGEDIFVSHVKAEVNVIRSMLGDIEDRRRRLGARVAARDVENALEDLVSIFEAALKAMTRRKLAATLPTADVERRMKDIGTGFQGVERATRTLQQQLAIDLATDTPESEMRSLASTFEKRHPIAHNLGVVDRKYRDRVRTGESEGRELRVSVDEVMTAAATSEAMLSSIHARIFAAERDT